MYTQKRLLALLGQKANKRLSIQKSEQLPTEHRSNAHKRKNDAVSFCAYKLNAQYCDWQNKWEFSTVFNGCFVPVYYWSSVGAMPIYFASRGMIN
jgi:hypothetical protein